MAIALIDLGQPNDGFLKCNRDLSPLGYSYHARRVMGRDLGFQGSQGWQTRASGILSRTARQRLSPRNLHQLFGILFLRSVLGKGAASRPLIDSAFSERTAW